MPEGAMKRLVIALILLVVTLGIGTAMYKILTMNHYDWMTCFYMTVITLSTVGYGEIIDTSMFPAARLLNSILILFGMGILLYSLPTVTAIMVEMDLRDVFKRRKMNKEIRQMRNHFIVCGAGATGITIAQELQNTGTKLVIIEQDPQRAEYLSGEAGFICVDGDAADDETLIRAGIDHAAGLAAALSSEKDNLFLTITARQLNPSIRIVARGLNESVERKLRKAGADAVVSPTNIGGLRMASELIRPSVVSFLDTMLRDTTGAIRFEEFPIRQGSKFVNQTIKTTSLRDSNLLVVALKETDSSSFIYNPSADTKLTDGMTLVLLGESKSINEVKEIPDAGI